MLLLWQIAIGTDDVYKTAEAVKMYGGQITREPGPLPGISTKVTACVDPDGWKTVSLKNSLFLFLFYFLLHTSCVSWLIFCLFFSHAPLP